jgi:ribonuclease HII
MAPRAYQIGIDEVGRGALAGPVYVAAVCIPTQYRIPQLGILKLRDSKKLSPAQRERWSAWIVDTDAIWCAISWAHATTVDRINVSRAVDAAAYRAYRLLLKQRPELGSAPCQILTDGGITLPKAVPHASIIRGDEREPVIALASIAAKVRRDAYMRRCSARYPAYGLALHKGYGTVMHRTAILRHGPGALHRQSFLKKLTSPRISV